MTQEKAATPTATAQSYNAKVQIITDIDKDQLKKWWNIFHSDGDVVEIRAIKGKHNYSGYFKEFDSLAECASKLNWEEKSLQYYFVMNRINDACFSRQQSNRMLQNVACTSHADITRRKWVLIDCDPKRPSGVSSSDAELELARLKALQVYQFLATEGFAEPVMAMSGNGYHLLYRIDGEVSSETNEMIHKFLKVLGAKFTDDVIIDESVHDPNRMCKLYGTWAKKGSNTPERPWRLANITFIPDKVEITPMIRIKAIADQYQIEHREMPNKGIPKETRTRENGFDVVRFLDMYNIGYTEKSMNGGGTKYVLDECPFDGTHKAPDAAVFKYADGSLGFRCLHNSCNSYHWRDFRLHFDPDAYKKQRIEEEILDDNKPADDIENDTDKDCPLLNIDWLKAYLDTVSECFNVPRSMVDCAVLAAASSAIGNKIWVCDGAFENSCALWIVLVAQSGAGKTPLLSEVLRPIKEAQIALQNQYNTQLEEWRMLPKKERDEVPKPVLQQRYISDTTPEALYEALGQHPSGLFLWRDEIGGMVKDIGRYNNSGEVENLLSIWSNQPITIRRKTSAPIIAQSPFLAICGGIQPALIGKVFGQDSFVENGFLARFLWAYPETYISETYEQRQIETELRKSWGDAISSLYSMPEMTLTLSDTALEVKKCFYRSLMQQLKVANERADLFQSAMLGKAIEYCDRIAGVLHCLEFTNDQSLPNQISGSTYENAIAAMEQFLRWGRKVERMLQPQSNSKQISDVEAILALHRYHPTLNISQLAQAIDRPRQSVSRIINKKRE